MGAAGVDAREPREHVHADYFVAHQGEFDGELLDLCSRNVGDSTPLTRLHDLCGTGA